MFLKKINNERSCKYCGEDISYKLISAIICGSKECTSAYKKDRYNNLKNKKERFCIICWCNISELDPRRKICLNPECEKERNARRYKNAKYIHICDVCNKEFEGTLKQKVCSECKTTSSKRRVESFKDITQKILCMDCGKLIREETKKDVGVVKEALYELCDECKQLRKITNSKNSSERMKTNNPMFNKEISKKVGDTLRQTYLNKCESLGVTPNKRTTKSENPETLEETRLRMHLNNPMYNLDTVQKMKDTLQQHIEDGTITYKKGKDNPLWKGNRPLNKAVRVALRNWVQHMFSKFNYTCQRCGKTHTELLVHHLEPLRNIIEKFLNNFNYTTEYLMEIEGNENYEKFIQSIVSYHFNKNEEIGIVVCPKCHYDIDEHYRRKTYDKEDK